MELCDFEVYEWSLFMPSSTLNYFPVLLFSISSVEKVFCILNFLKHKNDLETHIAPCNHIISSSILYILILHGFDLTRDYKAWDEFRMSQARSMPVHVGFVSVWGACFNPRPAGVFGRTRPLGGGADSAPLPNSRTDGRSKTGEGQSKALDEHSLKIFFENVLWRSLVRSRSGQRSTSLLFALSATETGLTTAANPNFAKRLP